MSVRKRGSQSQSPSKSSARRAVVAACFAASIATVGSRANAAPSARDVSDAEQDFAKARQLMSKGQNLEEACALFTESNRLDPGTGTLLNLAICHEKVGKIASAWADYNDVLAQSKQDNRPDRVTLAQKKLDELLPRLSSLSFVVPAASALPSLAISVDGRDRDQSLWNVEKYVDPGVHEVRASAPGKLPWVQSITVKKDHSQVKLTVPALADDPAALAAANAAANQATGASVPTAPPRQEARPERAMAGWIAGGVGVASLAVGTIFGISALSKNSDSKSACSAGCASDTAYSSANRDAWIADVTIPVGLVAIGIGAYLIVTARGDDEAPAATTGSRLVPVVNVGRSGSSFGLSGSF